MFTLILLYLGAHTGIIVAPPAVINTLAVVSVLESAEYEKEESHNIYASNKEDK